MKLNNIAQENRINQQRKTTIEVWVKIKINL